MLAMKPIRREYFRTESVGDHWYLTENTISVFDSVPNAS